MISLGGSTLPRATPRNAPMPSRSMPLRSMTSHARPCSRAIRRARSAMYVGVATFAGRFPRSRTWLTASPTIVPRRAPARAAAVCVSAAYSARALTSRRWSPLSVLYRVNRYRPIKAPSTHARAVSSGSPPTPTSNATRSQPASLARWAARAAACRTRSGPAPSRGPSPAATTARGGIRSPVCTRTACPPLPSKPAPLNADSNAAPNARATAPKALGGSPSWYRNTTTASSGAS